MKTILFALMGCIYTYCTFAAEPTTKPATTQPRIVAALLGAMRQPAPGQFPTPDSVVKFLLEQIKQQDLDEASKAFPVVEIYTRYDFATAAKHLQIIDPTGMPLPGAAFRNLAFATRPLAQFDQISLALLGLDISQVTIFKDHASAQEIKQVTDQLDRSRLRELDVQSVTARPSNIPEADDEHAKAIGMTERTEAVAKVIGPGKKAAELRFFVEKIDTNWRIVQCDIATQP